jgi:hypothetical protein
MPMDWRDALLAQARSDFEMLQFLRRHQAPFCHQLHFLQMATEKLGKGFATAPSGTQPLKVHRAFVGLLRSVKSSVQLQRSCHCGTGQVDAYIISLLPLARMIEDLAPSNANDGPNPEYPWRGQTGIIPPVDHEFVNLQFDERGMVNILKFLERCFQII